MGCVLLANHRVVVGSGRRDERDLPGRARAGQRPRGLHRGPERDILARIRNDDRAVEHLGGDPLATKDLQIISTYTVPSRWDQGQGANTLTNAGRVIKHTIDGSLAPIPENALDWSADPFTPQVTNDDSIVSERTADQTFGTAVLVPGGRLTFERDKFLGFKTGKRGTDGKSGFGFGEGVITHVMIVHTASGKVLYDKDVVVPW